jgi:hypothetical protein
LDAAVHPIVSYRREKGLTWENLAALVRGANNSKEPTAQTLQNIARSGGRPVGPDMAHMLFIALGIPRELLIYWNRYPYGKYTPERHVAQETVKEVRNGQNS